MSVSPFDSAVDQTYAKTGQIIAPNAYFKTGE